jgi:catechol 2,3-dioxygenase-like lactoylglutathione lyase family enzyme
MNIELNHMIIPSADKLVASRFYCRVLNLECIGNSKDFFTVRVNDKLVLNFKDSDEFDVHHYAFKVDDETFDIIFNNIKKEGLNYGSDPYDLENKKLNKWHKGRGVYFRDPNGHILELLTKEASN